MALAGSATYLAVAGETPVQPPAKVAQPEVKPVVAQPVEKPAAAKPADAKTAMKAAATADGKFESADGKELLAVVSHTDLCPYTIRMDDLKIGTGEEVKAGATLEVLYHGQFQDGSVLDSTRDRNNTPYEVCLLPNRPNSVIAGWNLGIPGMKVGGVRRLAIPYQLAYGENGRPPRVPGKTDLIFTIEVKSVKNLAEAAPAPATK
jgi:peptidylprolyl isomerase